MGDWWCDFFDETYRSLWAERTDEDRTAVDLDGIEAVLEAHAVRAPVRILDLACGDGRIAVGLALRGHAVTGLDLSRSMLDAARERARAAGAALDLVEADMRSAEIAGRHDVVISWFSAFGYFAEPSDDLAVLEAVHRALSPSGVLLLETTHRDLIASRPGASGRTWEDVGDLKLLTDRWFDPVSGRAGERLEILRSSGPAETRSFSVRAYTATELVALCRAADLHVEGIYGGPGPSPFGIGTRLLLVARRGTS